jgi:hypothetical protein
MWHGTEHDWPEGEPLRRAKRHVEPEEPIPKKPPLPRPPRDERAEAWADYVGYCSQIGTPQEQAFAYAYKRSLAAREEYFRTRPKLGEPTSLPLPFPRCPEIAIAERARVGDGGDLPCSVDSRHTRS